MQGNDWGVRAPMPPHLFLLLQTKATRKVRGLGLRVRLLGQGRAGQKARLTEVHMTGPPWGRRIVKECTRTTVESINQHSTLTLFIALSPCRAKHFYSVRI